MKHKPNCSINTICAVYHENGICNHPTYGKCNCIVSNNNPIEKKCIFCHPCPRERCVCPCHTPSSEKKNRPTHAHAGTTVSNCSICTPSHKETEEKCIQVKCEICKQIFYVKASVNTPCDCPFCENNKSAYQNNKPVSQPESMELEEEFDSNFHIGGEITAKPEEIKDFIKKVESQAKWEVLNNKFCDGKHQKGGCVLEKINEAKAQECAKIREKIEKGFNEFLLKDWSGEAEVEAEIARLKRIIFDSIE